jgi:hypothetical protein
MKKIILIFSAFICFTTASLAAESYFRLGMNTSDSYNLGDDGFQSEPSPGISIEAEQSLLLTTIGCGLAYNSEVKFSGEDAGFSTVPVYVTVKSHLFPAIIKPYAVLKAGKVFIVDDTTGDGLQGDFFYGGGIGIELVSVQLELFYSVSQIKGDSRGDDNLQLLGVSAGWKLF